MEAAVKCDKFIALGRVPGQLDGALHRLRAGVGEKYFLVFRARHGPGQFLGEHRQALVIKICSGHVDEFSRLLLNRFHNLGMAMPGGAHRYACGKIQKGVAVDVFDHRSATALGYQRIVAGERRRHKLRIEFDDLLGFGSRQGHQQPGQFRFCGSNHLFLL